MATSQQGKKKKKVLSQQQIDKLLGMLREEDKPLRAGILAKTLGYQSARDINPTLLRLEGYGTVCRVTMNNTPLWKYVNNGNLSTVSLTAEATSASHLQNGGDIISEEPVNGIADGGRIRLLQHPPDNGTMQQVIIEAREDSCPSRPQSTKADLEWDPTDIQVHHDEGNGDCCTVDTEFLQLYNNNATTGSTMYINSHHSMPNGLMVMDQSSNSDQMNGTMNFTATSQGYMPQDLYSTVDSSALDQMNIHNLDGKMANNSFVSSGQEYVGISTYNGNGDVNLNGNYNLEYTQQNSQNDASRCAANDMYMMSTSNMRHVPNGMTVNSIASTNLHSFPIMPNQVPSEYPSSNGYTSAMANGEITQKGSATSAQRVQQGYPREAHNVSHYNHNTYTSNSNGIGQMPPSYVVQDIIKSDSVRQYGMGGTPGDAQSVGGYQSLHHHGMDPGVMSFSQQPYHTVGGLANQVPSTPHHQQQQMAPPQSQHHPQHHVHHQPVTQTGNFVNIGTFANGSYNQYPGNYRIAGSGRGYVGQGPGYSSGNIASKDITNYTGGSCYRGPHIKRQHFNGYSTVSMFPNQVRLPLFGKVNHTRPPFRKQGFERNQTDRRRGHHSQAKGGISNGQREMSNVDFEDSKVKQNGGPSNKDSAKSQQNKYVGTEVLDDICRRLALTGVQKKGAVNRSSSVSSASSTQTEEPATCKEDVNMPDIDNGIGDKEKTEDIVKKESEEVTSTKAITKCHGALSATSGDKLTNGSNKECPSGSRPHNNRRIYGGTTKYQQYPYRNGHHARDSSRHQRGDNHSSRNMNGRTKGPSASSPNSCSSEKLTVKNVSEKVVSVGTGNGKGDCSKEEKDVSKGSEKPIKTNAEVLCEELGCSTSQVDNDCPMGKYRAVLVDHLDPNNVLLSHLFVRGLIDRVLVDQVRRMKMRRDAMAVLMPALIKIPKDALCTGFCEALHKSGQAYLAELIKSTGLEGDAMTEKHAAYLKLHHQNIAASMIPDKDLLIYLRTDTVLTADLHRFISTQPSRAQQIDTLLQILPFRGDKAFETFRTALRRSGQPWLAEQIAMELS